MGEIHQPYPGPPSAGATGAGVVKLTLHSAPWNWISLWLLSQNGFREEAPHRHRAMPLPGTVSTTFPAASSKRT